MALARLGTAVLAFAFGVLFASWPHGFGGFRGLKFGSPTARSLPLVSREWKIGSNSSYNCTPFLHSLLTKGKVSTGISST